MPFTDTTDQAILDHFFGKAEWTAPAQIWAGYSTSTPNKDGTGATEPGAGYARVQVLTAGWGRSASTMDNEAEIVFPQATGSQGTITYALLWDAETVGNLLWYGAYTTPKEIANEEYPRFPAGDFNATMS